MSTIFWYFLLYSFLGFALEVVFARVTRSPKRDRKCLFLLPLCPVYGLGALLILSLPAGVLRRPALLFLGGALCATAAEYFAHWFCQTALRVRFWDYSALKGSLNGRVCLPFSLAWGALALALVRWVHPIAQAWVRAIPDELTLPAALLVSADGLFSAVLLRATQDTASLRWYDRLRRPVRKRS